MGHDNTVFGFQRCRLCPTQVWEIVARRTDGLCVPCFNEHLETALAPIEVAMEGRVVAATIARRRRSGQRTAQKQRYRRRPDVIVHRRNTKLAGDRALRRLRDLFPELYDCFVAQERARLGLDAWTLDRLLAGGSVRSSLDFAATYADAPKDD